MGFDVSLQLIGHKLQRLLLMNSEALTRPRDQHLAMMCSDEY